MAQRPFQIGIRDILLVTYIVAAVAASISTESMRIGLLALAFLGMYAWTRPLFMRFWLVATAGIGSGLLTAMFYLGLFGDRYIVELGATAPELAGWGTGLLIGSLIAWRLLLSKPPQ